MRKVINENRTANLWTYGAESYSFADDFRPGEDEYLPRPQDTLGRTLQQSPTSIQLPGKPSITAVHAAMAGSCFPRLAPFCTCLLQRKHRPLYGRPCCRPPDHLASDSAFNHYANDDLRRNMSLPSLLRCRSEPNINLRPRYSRP